MVFVRVSGKIDPIPNIYRINIFYREKIWLFYFRVEIFIRIIGSLQEQHYIEKHHILELISIPHVQYKRY
ncbi:uncharacterized protein OCT59_021109 [Rhizophagus irregularis]|uniref:uncharacterized protein n=1 Tax=Rhizophagus irregularis TaxID=588596 RepID=UPI00332D2012|nr:hypothetical protein OCT59_021109 [Rhizophagus irregularis]